ncbi:MAG TPA: hypothetical protein VFH08_08975 [Chitinophagaceae bacterium]|nr:hypothetical protein [Chitinophagaceae bacterium]
MPLWLFNFQKIFFYGLKLFRRWRIESLPQRTQEPQLPLWLFNFPKIFFLWLKVVPPLANRIPPSPHSRVAIAIVAFYFSENIFLWLKVFRRWRIESLPHRTQEPTFRGAILI